MATKTVVSPLRAITARRAVAGSAIIGLIVWALLRALAPDILPVARMLIAWDVTVALYLASVFSLLHDASAEDMARHAAEHRIGRHFVMIVSVAALVISLAVIVFEIRAIAAHPDRFQGLLVLFVLTTVSLSWLFIHTSFATHYAFDYYGTDDGGRSRRGGLELPSGKEPTFSEIWNFAIVIGLCFATADINITSRSIRQISTIHGICSFLFNTVLLAATVSFTGAFLNPGT